MACISPLRNSNGGAPEIQEGGLFGFDMHVSFSTTVAMRWRCPVPLVPYRWHNNESGPPDGLFVSASYSSMLLQRVYAVTLGLSQRAFCQPNHPNVSKSAPMSCWLDTDVVQHNHDNAPKSHHISTKQFALWHAPCVASHASKGARHG